MQEMLQQIKQPETEITANKINGFRQEENSSCLFACLSLKICLRETFLYVTKS